MNVSADRIRQWFFSLSTWGELYDFIATLDPSDPFEASLRYYAISWPAPSDPSAVFEPEAFVSADLSATHFLRCPVIFEGSNQWARKCYLRAEDHTQKVDLLYARCEQFRRVNPNGRICLILVPEKDFLISHVLLHEGRFDPIMDAIQALRSRLAPLEVALLFEQPVIEFAQNMSIDDFQYADSHLPPAGYIQIFSHAIRSIGFDWGDAAPLIAMEKLPVYFDLSTKFKGGEDRPFDSFEVGVKDSKAVQISGSKYFESPLSETTQSFENSCPVFDSDVALLGDSHSSIFSQRRLTYLFANTFRETEFAWNPCGIKSEPAKIDRTNLILEISSRFVF